MKETKNMIVRYLEGSLDDKEKSILLKQIRENKETAIVFLEMKKVWDMAGDKKNLLQADTARRWQKVSDAIGTVGSMLSIRQNIFIKRTFVKYAAVFVFGGVLGIAILSRWTASPKQFAVAMHEIIVPKGQKSTVILSDGTKIWLNSGTHLRYPERFLNHNRNVYLEGEAYFDVARKKRMSFIVHAGNLDIRVLGTVFNVKNYPEDRKIETTLLEGRISLMQSDRGKIRTRRIDLHPLQKATFLVNERKMIVENIPADKNNEKSCGSSLLNHAESAESSAVLWKDNVLFFNDESLAEIIVKLERWYGYTIEVKNKYLLDQRYKGRFENNETIYQVLDAIKLTTPMIYTIDGKNIIIQ